MQSRMRSLFGTRCAGYVLATATFLAVTANVSFAGISSNQLLRRSTSQANPALLPPSVQPYYLSAATDKPGNPNPGVHPPGSKPYGLSYGEWSVKWWQRILSIPTAENPNLDPDGRFCGEMQSGNVFFLAGTFGGPATRTCTIRTGTSVLISILATVFGSHLGDCLSPGWGNPGPCDVDTLRASAAAEEDNPQALELSLDGVPLQDLAAYRAKSPVFSFALGDGTTSQNIVSYLFNFPVPDGTYYPAVADGYWVMFTPLQPGVHTIVSRGVEHVGSTLPPVELNYTLIVVAGR